MAGTKLLLCNHQAPAQFVGGAEFILLDIASNLDRDKFDPLVLSNGNGAFTEMAVEAGMPVRTIPHEMIWDFLAPGKDIADRFERFKAGQKKSVESIAQLIRENGIRALIANCLVNTVPLMAAEECRVPSIWMIHEIVHAFDSMRHGFYKIFRARPASIRRRHEIGQFLRETLLRYSRLSVFITETSRNKIFDALAWRDRAVVIHPPVRRDVFYAPEPSTRSYPGIPDKSFSVVFLGILVPHKGVHDFIRAASLVARTAANVHFTIAGGSPDAEYVRRMKKMAGEKIPAGRSQFTGFLDNPVPLIDRADVICMPSLYEEPFGMVVTEGMARGKVVLAYDTGSIREVIEEGKTGFIVPRGNTSALARKIVELSNDRDVMKSAGAKAAAAARTRFDPENYIAQLEEIVERVVAR